MYVCVSADEMLQVLLDTLCDTELLRNVSKIVMAVTSLMF